MKKKNQKDYLKSISENETKKITKEQFDLNFYKI